MCRTFWPYVSLPFAVFLTVCRLTPWHLTLCRWIILVLKDYLLPIEQRIRNINFRRKILPAYLLNKIFSRHKVCSTKGLVTPAPASSFCFSCTDSPFYYDLQFFWNIYLHKLCNNGKFKHFSTFSQFVIIVNQNQTKTHRLVFFSKRVYVKLQEFAEIM